MCYSGRLICSMLALIPQSGDFSGAALGVRSVVLLQVAYSAGDFIYLVKHKNRGFLTKIQKNICTTK